MRRTAILAFLLGIGLAAYAIASALTLGFAEDQPACDNNGASVVTWDTNAFGTVFGLTITDVDQACIGDYLYAVVGSDTTQMADALAQLTIGNTGSNLIVMPFTEIGDSVVPSPQWIPDITKLELFILAPVASVTPTATSISTSTPTPSSFTVTTVTPTVGPLSQSLGVTTSGTAPNATTPVVPPLSEVKSLAPNALPLTGSDGSAKTNALNLTILGLGIIFMALGLGMLEKSRRKSR